MGKRFSRIALLTVGILFVLAAAASAKTVNLAWDANTDPTVTGYKVYYSTSANPPYNGTGAFEGTSPVDVGNKLTASINGLPSDQVHYFTVTAYDAAGYESYYSNVVVSSASLPSSNQAPVLATIGGKTVNEGASLTFTLSASDPDGDSLSYSASGLPSGASFNATTRTFSWTPGYGQAGSYAPTFSVSDGNLSDAETVTISVGNTNRPPVLATVGGKTVNEGASLTFTLSASDPDGDSLSYSASGLPSGASFNATTRTFSWTPGSGQAGSYAPTFSVSDGSLSDAETVTISVGNSNRPPVLATIGGKTVNEGASLTFTLSASDPDGDSLSYSASGLPSGASFNAATRTFSWTPGYGQAGSYAPTFSVSDGSLSDAETVTISVGNSNRPPVLANIGGKTVNEGASLTFTLSASDPDGDSLSYSASGLPSGASFNATTRTFNWTPGSGQAGSYAPTFSVSDGSLSDTVTVTISVSSGGAVDSDGDGFVDSQDAFPNDPAEWLDTDLDGIGNNRDPDDDNDGVIDTQDGAPLDAASSSWVITAVNGNGGQVTPPGDSFLAYGASQGYAILPDSGYLVEDVLIDGISVGAVQSYLFTAVAAHHSIEALFAPIPSGLRAVPGETGLSGVDRVDGGDDSGNLVDGLPKADLDYVFRVVYQDASPASAPTVYLVLNGFAYRMTAESGDLLTGATYAFTTRLGPIAAQTFHFETRDSQGIPLARYPADFELDAPQVELLNGANIVGAPGHTLEGALDSQAAFGTSLAFRWVSGGASGGHYELVNDSGPVQPGEGYIIKRSVDPFLPPLAGESATSWEISVAKGWNLVSNPFGGNVSLKDVLVRNGSAQPVTWSDAAARQLVLDGIYAYSGEDWGSTSVYMASGGAHGATLVPGVGYWIYINTDGGPVSLIVPKPEQ